MHWIVFFIISVISLLTAVVLVIVNKKGKIKKRASDTPTILLLGVIASAVFLFIPLCYNMFSTNDCGVFETILIAVHSVIRMFIVDGEFDAIIANLDGVPRTIYRCYTGLFAILFVVAPILTFSFILSLFKNASAHLSYIAHYWSNLYIFSDLNPRSVALAESICSNKGRNRRVIFANASRTEYLDDNLTERVRKLRAICFENNITAIDYFAHSAKSQMSLFVISENQSNNISQALQIVEDLRSRKNTNLYVFSTQPEAEILMANAFESDGNGRDKAPSLIMIRRIDEVRSLVNVNLYDNGYKDIFSSAYTDEDGNKRITALIVGMGRHGIEMLKALPWFCQMDGYKADIYAFDKDDTAGDKFESLCPELVAMSGTNIPGESQYSLSIRSGVDVETRSFDNIIKSLPRVTYVFVTLGNDERNVFHGHQAQSAV